MPAQKPAPYVVILIGVLVSLFSGAGIQIAAGLLWGGKAISRIDQLEQSQKDQDVRVERLDIRGSQQLPLIDQRLKTIDDVVKHNTGRIDSLIQQGSITSPIGAIAIRCNQGQYVACRGSAAPYLRYARQHQHDIAKHED